MRKKYTKQELQYFAQNTWRMGYGYDSPKNMGAFAKLQKEIEYGRIKSPKSITNRAIKYGAYY